MAFVVIDAQLTSSTLGGKRHPFCEGYCPHLVAERDGIYLGVRLVDCPEMVQPGETKRLKFQLLYYPQVDYSPMEIGSAVDIREGGNTIGQGRVVSMDFH